MRGDDNMFGRICRLNWVLDEEHINVMVSSDKGTSYDPL